MNNDEEAYSMREHMRAETLASYANLMLVVLFPIAWFAPLIRTGLLPEWQLPDWLGGEKLFSLTEVTVVSGLQALWATDLFLAIAVTFFALVAPMLKCLGLALIDFRLLDKRSKPVLGVLGKLAMADIFILSLYVVIIKGIGIGEVEVAWGLYLFTSCVMLSLLLSLYKRRSA
jgi:uncharacterized paraquat-inducible protein A